MTDKEVKQFVRKCMNHLKKKRYELGITKADVDYAVKVTRTANTLSARAGKNKIYIGLRPWQWTSPHRRLAGQEKTNDCFHEYPAFDKDPVIGFIRTGTLENMLRVIIAHEVSHHVQRRIAPHVRRYDNRCYKPHGYVFRDIYRMLRRDLINPLIMDVK